MPDAVIPHPPAVPAPASASAARNIVICCDGTGNQFGDTNSNVVKLYTTLKVDEQQVAYYHPGVGTMGDPSERYRIPRLWSQIKGLAFANGFSDNVLDAYRYLMTTYRDGDRIYFFGFSRGSYTVRALAGLLHGYGLLCRGNEGHLPYAWRLYLNQHDDRNRDTVNTNDASALAFKETFSHKNLKIHFIGIWDTVSSVGWIYSPLRLFNVARNPSILRGRHAVSIDERRCFYRDNLWGDAYPEQDLVQVWFAGVHSDIGGSYKQTESGLSNIALEWMLNEAEDAGAILSQDRVKMVLGEPGGEFPDADLLFGKPSTSNVHPSLNGWWWVLEYIPGRYYDKYLRREAYRVPRGVARHLPDRALLHHSAYERMSDQSTNYRPENVQREHLVPVAYPVPHAAKNDNPLYEYRPPALALPSQFKRLLPVILLAVVYVLLGIAVLLGAIVLCVLLGHFIYWLYGKLSDFIFSHLALLFDYVKSWKRH